MSLDLEQQLSAYGSWFAETSGTEMTRPAGGPDEPESPGGQPTSSGSGRGWLRVAAALLVVSGLGGLVIARGDAGSPAVSEEFAQPIDPFAHLFVLPSDRDDLVFSGGDVLTARRDDGVAPNTAITRSLVGREIEGGFADLVSVSVIPSVPDAFLGPQQTEVSTPKGPATVAGEDRGFDRVAQQHGDVWVLMTGATGTDDLLNLLQHVSVDASGSIEIMGGDRAVIEEFGPWPAAADFTTAYTVIDPSTGQSFYVETATFGSALLPAAYWPSPVLSMSVNGAQAWTTERDDGGPAGPEIGIAWRATPNRIVAISARAPFAEVREMAERLVGVSSEVWDAALPGAFREE